jgi:membrane-bound ClpP family serine protease
VAASVGFIIGLGSAGIRWDLALALLVGGVIAAPIAAYLVRIAPAYLLGIAVSGVILITNSRTLMKAAEVDDGSRWVVYGLVLAVVIAGGVFVVLRHRRQTRERKVEKVEETASV